MQETMKFAIYNISYNIKVTANQRRQQTSNVRLLLCLQKKVFCIRIRTAIGLFKLLKNLIIIFFNLLLAVNLYYDFSISTHLIISFI